MLNIWRERVCERNLFITSVCMYVLRESVSVRDRECERESVCERNSFINSVCMFVLRESVRDTYLLIYYCPMKTK